MSLPPFRLALAALLCLSVLRGEEEIGISERGLRLTVDAKQAVNTACCTFRSGKWVGAALMNGMVCEGILLLPEPGAVASDEELRAKLDALMPGLTWSADKCRGESCTGAIMPYAAGAVLYDEEARQKAHGRKEMKQPILGMPLSQAALRLGVPEGYAQGCLTWRGNAVLLRIPLEKYEVTFVEWRHVKLKKISDRKAVQLASDALSLPLRFSAASRRKASESSEESRILARSKDTSPLFLLAERAKSEWPFAVCLSGMQNRSGNSIGRLITFPSPARRTSERGANELPEVQKTARLDPAERKAESDADKTAPPRKHADLLELFLKSLELSPAEEEGDENARMR